MFQFKPVSEEEAAAESDFELLPAGVYPFTVIDADERQSKAGNDMIALKLDVFGPKHSRHVYDYLLEKMAFKLRHFASSCGVMDAYEKGTIDVDALVGLDGYVKLAIEERDGYEPRNVVRDYVVKETPGAKLDAKEPRKERKYAEDVTARGQAQRAAKGKTAADDVPF